MCVCVHTIANLPEVRRGLRAGWGLLLFRVFDILVHTDTEYGVLNQPRTLRSAWVTLRTSFSEEGFAVGFVIAGRRFGDADIAKKKKTQTQMARSEQLPDGMGWHLAPVGTGES